MSKIGKARLDAMVEEAIVDANGESERATGLFAMIENNLELPFETTILGMPVVVEKIDLNRRDEIVAVCRRGKSSNRADFEPTVARASAAGRGAD